MLLGHNSYVFVLQRIDAKDHGFTITWDDKTLHLQAASKEERTKWVEALVKYFRF